MQISSKTQIEMYNYLISNKIVGIDFGVSNSQEFLINAIKVLAKILNSRTELFVKKAIVELNSENLSVRENCWCSSNHLIYYVLNDIKGCKGLLKPITENNSNKDSLHIYEEFPDGYMGLPENSGSVGRGKLIKLCKMYLSEKEIEITSKKKGVDQTFLAKESELAEKALHKYSQQLGNHIKVQGNNLLPRLNNAYALKSDIILKCGDKAIVVDIKVYSSISEKEKEKLLYKYNSNRYQVNSYIGAYKNKDKTVNEVSGLIVHIVNHELYEKNKEINGAELTIEPDRPMKLLLIEDRGLEQIFADYTEIINKELFNLGLPCGSPSVF